ncbi:ATP-dependent bile acid permease [Diutina catenulata]
MTCRFWDYDDLTRCSRERLEVVPAVAIAGLSAVVLAVSAAHQWRRRRVRVDTERPLRAEPEVSVKAKHFDLTRLPDTNADGSPHGTTKWVYKTTCESMRVALEWVLVASEVAIAAAPFFNHHIKLSAPARSAQLALWTYLLVLVSVRTLNIRTVRVPMPNVWVHSTAAYFFAFPVAAVLARSALVRGANAPTRAHAFAAAGVNLALVVLNFAARTGDRPAAVYVPADGTTPSPEPVSSLFALVSYSWLDPMVKTAASHWLLQSEVWGLRGDDYALPILKSFERFASGSRFPVKLFLYFKWLLAVQALWAVLEAFLIFVPSLLLKRILEYVENPQAGSKNLAWTFVVLMPVFKVLDSVSSGCSLFVGRRVCLRMKAIIIGEVYAKALRRRITAADMKEEGGVATEAAEERVAEARVAEERAGASGAGAGATGAPNGAETGAGAAGAGATGAGAAGASAGASANADSDSSSSSDSSDSSSSAELGAIINLMAIDAFKVSELCGYLHFFVGSVVMIVVCITLLYGLIGWSALVGAATIIVLLPVSYKMAAWGASLQKKMLGITDKRIQKLNETFGSIRIIKFFAWEQKFFDSVMKIRADELYQLKLRTIAWCIGAVVWFITPTLVTITSFYCYTMVAGQTLTAPVAFVALSLFTILRTPLDQLADMTAFMVQSKVSLDRVDEFLSEPESTKYDQLSKPRGPRSPEVGFEGATFAWNRAKKADFRLRDLDVAFAVGQLNVVIGATGSGKTSLLLALLGEMDLVSGSVYLPGAIPRAEAPIDPATGLADTVAYCSQLPWLLNDTIKNNIVFAASFNPDRYRSVIEACGLKRDLEILSAGDATEIGEKGITLSGGQKQRVSLARALYSNSKTLLLDDCLSAVDSHTAAWIYEHCITGPLMKGRTCVLVSHNVALTVSEAAHVVALENGRVVAQGAPSELLESGHLGDDELVKSSVISSQAASREASRTDLKGLATDLKAKAAVLEAKLERVRDDGNQADTGAASGPAPGSQPDEPVKDSGKLVEDEAKSEGTVDAKVYWSYARYLGGFWAWAVMLSAFGLSQGLFMLQSWWLRVWSMNAEAASAGQLGWLGHAMVAMAQFHAAGESAWAQVQDWKDGHSTMYYLWVYAALGVSYAVLASCRVFVTFFAGIRASNKIFKDLLTRILHANLRFFDKTPLGRIMNRFSKDMESVDQELTPMAEGVFICVVQCFSTLVLIVVITPKFLFFAFIIAGLYYLVGYFYLSLSRELKRYESITKSPIHQHFSESLTGVATIRAYGVESRFMRENLVAIDANNRPFFYLWVANRWLSFRVDVVGSLVMLTAGVFVLLSIGSIDAGLAGLSLSYAIAFSESALWIVRLYSNVEMNMNSVERLQEYLEVEQEPPYEVPETKPAPSWPESGKIAVDNVSLRYAPNLPQVIKNVSFVVEPCHKVGIVGRTGAGKSTIITAFFRFLECETGSIEIDGVDISKIGLRDLRQAITIIPQDPTLFTGTIRSNLDPFEQYQDSEIFEALRRVNLLARGERESTPEADENSNKFLKLDNAITEGGGNLSQGERQLVCLARSLLKNPKVMLLDEATSSIDYKSDAMIQTTIREEFGNSTILTIAHRLRTIIDYDKILVMDAGKVVEYDNPYVLITKTDSLFYGMCENSGELESLVKLAKEAYTKKLNK